MAFGDQYPSNLGYLLAKVETTYGTDSVPAAVDFLYTEEKTVTIQTNTEQRTGVSPNRVGWGAVATNVVGTASGICEVRPITIALVTDLPAEDAIWRSCGFSLVSDIVSDPKTQTYTLQPTEGESATLYSVMLNVGKTEGILHKLPGFRGTITLNITKNERWKLNFEGEGKACELPKKIDSGTTPPIETGLSDADDLPLVGTGARVSIFDTVASKAFGGGTEAVPLCEAFVDSADIAFNMGVVRRSAINCSDGCGGRIELRPGAEYMTGTMVMELTSLDDWDYWAIQAERRPVKIVIEQPVEASGIDGVRLTFDAELTDFTLADLEGDMAATCTWIAIYPEDSGEFGTTPADLATFVYFTKA